MNKSESQLRTDFATQIGEVQSQLTAAETALTRAIADAKATGLQGDAALQAAINTVAGDLGVTKADLLTQMGKSEAQLRTDFATQISGVQSQLGDVQKAISDQMAAYEAAGLARDDALSLAISDVSQQLGTTKADLLSQLGTTEANLKAELTSQIGGVTADVQAKYNSLTAQQKALADQLIQQGVDLNTAIDQAKTTIASDVQTKFDALTDQQKALAQQLAQQGVDFNTAIQQAQAQTQGQITGVQQDVQTKYNTLSQNQQQLAQDLQRQGFDLNTAIELARTQTSAGFEDIRNTLTANQDATQRAIAEAAAQTQAKAAADAEATRQAQAAQAAATRDAAARNAANQAKLGNVNSLLGMLGQAGDVGGQQVTVKPADPSKIGYIYDFNSIFANPSQEKMFASPYGSYAQGGTVDEVNDELLKLLRG